MVLDIELTLNRFGFKWIQPNKVQFAMFRVAWWRLRKYAVSFEVNWQLK